jgi:hypothetical protein
LTAHYTYARALTNTSGREATGFGGAIENAYDRAAEWGNDENIPYHRFVGYFIWDAPRFNQYHPLIEGVIGGWKVTGNFTANSGLFYTPIFTGRDISGTNITTGRPDRIGDGNLGDARTLQREFDVSAFVVPAANSGRFGNSGRGVIQGRGYWGGNMGFFKYFGITESIRFRLAANVRNVFNHPKFGGRVSPNMNITTLTAGFTTAVDTVGLNEVDASRVIDVGLRLEW